MMFSRLLFLASSVLAVFTVGACSRHDPPPIEAFGSAQQESLEHDDDDDEAAAEVIIAVDGMVCQSCANAAGEVASHVPGVVSARGIYEDGTVVVRYRPEATTPITIAEAITAAERGEAPAFAARALTD